MQFIIFGISLVKSKPEFNYYYLKFIKKAMRKLVLSLLAVSILSVNFVFSNPTTKSIKVSKTDKVIEILKSKIKYPIFAEENNIEAEVLVSLKVDKNGDIEVEQINSSNKIMSSEILHQLEKIKIAVDDSLINQLLNFRFVFEII